MLADDASEYDRRALERLSFLNYKLLQYLLGELCESHYKTNVARSAFYKRERNCAQ
jgi:hypothetical protein